MSPKAIDVKGARVHNLKNLNVSIPRDKLVVVTGVSGSGKSSLAFDTIYAEGQRRYVESLSSYARQFLDQMDKPDVDAIEGLSPAIAIQQKTTSNNPRSTVATVTEIYDYLRLLYARAGTPSCPSCGQPVQRQTAQEIVDQVLAEPEKTRLILLAPISRRQKGSHEQAIRDLQRDGFTRIRLDGDLLALDESLKVDKRRKHDLDVVVDRIAIKEGVRSRLNDSIELALRHGEGRLILYFPDRGEERQVSEHLTCLACNLSLPELEPRLFSFNSPQGACPECNGLGELPYFDPALVVPNPELSIAEGAVAPWNAKGSWYRPVLEAVASHYGQDVKTPWRKLPSDFRDKLLEGSGDEPIEVVFDGDHHEYKYKRPFEGVIGNLRRRMRETTSDNVRTSLEAYQSVSRCPQCEGSRLRPESKAVRIGERSIGDACALPISEASTFFAELDLNGSTAEIAEPILKEVRARLGFLNAVGLGYLSLSRRAGTLSGGEAQRIRLATQIGSALMGVLYVLDEPSIGLHQRDNERLIETLCRLRDLGNSVLVVEHDKDTMDAADWILDLGPGAGREGGAIVASGTPKALRRSHASLTGQYLAGKREVSAPREPRATGEACLRVVGARANNLNGVDVEVPLGIFVCVTGVSGSGKSSLINHTLLPWLSHQLHNAKAKSPQFERIEGLEHLDKVIAIDQLPIGRTPRSNPATYTGLFSDIRELFASLPEAKTRGFKAGRFSFNVKGGRCETCEGDGIRRIEMHFLPDVYVQCETCGGRRYNSETLEVRYRGVSIADLLELTVDDAYLLLKAVPPIERKLRRLREVGLGYVHLGQSATTLSGGEAQRVKLAKELARVATGRTLYVLDEPTTGLHFEDVRKLLDVLQRLVDQGNSVVVIEHDLDVIRSADYLIDMGPEGGIGGGTVVATGTPAEVAANKSSHTGRFLAPLFAATKPSRRKSRRAKKGE